MVLFSSNSSNISSLEKAYCMPTSHLPSSITYNRCSFSVTSSQEDTLLIPLPPFISIRPMTSGPSIKRRSYLRRRRPLRLRPEISLYSSERCSGTGFWPSIKTSVPSELAFPRSSQFEVCGVYTLPRSLPLTFYSPMCITQPRFPKKSLGF